MKNIMKQKKTTITTSMVIAMLVVTAMVISKLMGFSFADNTFTVLNGKYIITSEKNMTAQYTGVSKNSVTSVNIPATIKIKEKNYKVTSIKENALKANKKVKKVTIGINVKTVGKNAFYGCKNLKTVTISTTKLTISSVKANAFKGLNSKAVVIVPEEKLTVYKKILKAKGLTGKRQTVKEKKMEEKEEENKEEEVPEVTFGPDHPLPDPVHAVFSIGDISTIGSDYFDSCIVKESTEYSAGDTIPFSTRIYMQPEIYGTWGKREAYGKWEECRCGKKFDSNSNNFAVHVAMTPDNVCFGDGNFSLEEEAYTEWYWIPDYEPCKTVFNITLPKGLSYKDGSLKLWHFFNGEIDSGAYHTEISDSNIKVTIDDIKTEPFFIDHSRTPISVLFDTEMNDDTTVTNTASASVAYSYKGLEKTIDLGDLFVHTLTLQVKNTDTSGSGLDGSGFTLYKGGIDYNNSGMGTMQFNKICELQGGPEFIFNNLGEGKYKLVQTSVPAGYHKMPYIIFNITIKDGKPAITGVIGNPAPSWDIDTKTGIISITIVNTTN